MLVVPAMAAAQQKAKPAVKKSVAAPKSTFKNGLDSLSYAFGASIGKNLKTNNVDTLNYALLVEGFKDALRKGGKSKIDEATCNNVISTKMQELAGKGSAKEKMASNKFLEANKKKKGINTTASGLQYEVITMGTGVKPTANDTVVCHYRGTLINGKEFDNSYSRGEPISFPVGGVIRGWTEALQLMPKGSKWKLYIPSDLGYGDKGAGQDIPGGSALIFEVELLNIKPGTTK